MAHPRDMPSRKSPIPWLLKALLFSLVSLLGILGMRLVPSTFAEGWTPVITLFIALGLIAAALFEVVRRQKR